MNAIETRDLTKRFRRVEALNGLTLEVPAGAVYAFVGPNGAGKTTAIKVLMNILRATAGSAKVLGANSHDLRGKAFVDIGYVSENQQLPEWMRVAEFLAYLRPFYPKWDRALEDALIKQFDLPRDRRLKNLSRGMRMKAALAGALAFHPRLIVLDEPFTGLDPLVRDELIQSLLDRAEESTVFISSHDLAEIESFASHVGYIENGRLRLSEEMSALTHRFRQVELTFDIAPPLATELPPSWLQVHRSEAVIRFAEAQFDAQRTPADIRRFFGEPRNESFEAMSLREMFLTMAKSSRRQE